MKKIVVFGDSFVSYNWVKEETEKLSWPYFLSLNLDLLVVNYGISGSGLNYSMIKFTEYVNSEDYDTEDIIIFALTNEQRLYSWDMPCPSLGIFPNLLNVLDSRSPKERQWIEKNKDNALWAMNEFYHPSINYSLLKIASFFRMWARKNYTNTVVLLRCFNTLPEGEKISKHLNLVTPLDNYFPILKEEDTLSMASSQEFGYPLLHKYMLDQNARFPGLDYRVNHLSTVNRNILASKVEAMIKEKSINGWDKIKFKKNLYSNKKDINLINNKFF